MSQVLHIKYRRVFLIVFILATYYIIQATAPAAQAQTMSNSSYILQMSNLNTAAGKPTGDSYKLNLTVGQTAPGLYTGDNYKIRAGFQYISSIIRFSFSISQTVIDFGTLTATNPVTRASDLTISNGSANGYSITASENHQLQVAASGALIPDATCDNGTCTPTTSAAWTNTLTYGFGYRCDNVTGTDCASGFSDATYYKQFSASPSAQTVMSGTNVGKNKKSTITYKVNISGTQAAGLYTNTIAYIATPTF